MAPLPVIVCGRNPEIAKVVREGLMPEYEVIHIITTPQAGAAEIPLLLAGKTPATFENFGSGNYSKRPVAVATGGGYDDEGFKLMRGACNSDPNAKIVPWLRPDMSRILEMPSLDDVRAFGLATAERVKKALQELKLSEEQEEKEEWKTKYYHF